MIVTIFLKIVLCDMILSTHQHVFLLTPLDSCPMLGNIVFLTLACHVLKTKTPDKIIFIDFIHLNLTLEFKEISQSSVFLCPPKWTLNKPSLSTFSWRILSCSISVGLPDVDISE